jgi:hypothetical protein
MTKFLKFSPLSLMVLWLLLIQVRCEPYDYINVHLIPVYADSVKIHTVMVEPPRNLLNTAKIYYKDSMIYIIEKNEGIHVVDNRQPKTPTPVRFIKIGGCEDIAIKDNTLYADNYTDLVALDISNPEKPVMVSRIPGLYPADIDGKPSLNQQNRYEYISTYECIDSKKGKVISWQEGVLDSTKCYKKF